MRSNDQRSVSLQFTSTIEFHVVRHRPTSQVIHRSEFSHIISLVQKPPPPPPQTTSCRWPLLCSFSTLGRSLQRRCKQQLLEPFWTHGHNNFAKGPLSDVDDITVHLTHDSCSTRALCFDERTPSPLANSQSGPTKQLTSRSVLADAAQPQKCIRKAFQCGVGQPTACPTARTRSRILL